MSSYILQYMFSWRNMENNFPDNPLIWSLDQPNMGIMYWVPCNMHYLRAKK